MCFLLYCLQGFPKSVDNLHTTSITVPLRACASVSCTSPLGLQLEHTVLTQDTCTICLCTLVTTAVAFTRQLVPVDNKPIYAHAASNELVLRRHDDS